jgi:hypothetical protein
MRENGGALGLCSLFFIVVVFIIAFIQGQWTNKVISSTQNCPSRNYSGTIIIVVLDCLLIIISNITILDIKMNK